MLFLLFNLLMTACLGDQQPRPPSQRIVSPTAEETEEEQEQQKEQRQQTQLDTKSSPATRTDVAEISQQTETNTETETVKKKDSDTTEADQPAETEPSEEATAPADTGKKLADGVYLVVEKITQGARKESFILIFKTLNMGSMSFHQPHLVAKVYKSSSQELKTDNKLDISEQLLTFKCNDKDKSITFKQVLALKQTTVTTISTDTPPEEVFLVGDCQ